MESAMAARLVLGFAIFNLIFLFVKIAINVFGVGLY